jgi:tRNA-dihydrouridine synthase 2
LYCGEGLAPMVRASTTPLRMLALQYGAEFVYTEEIIDRSLLETRRVVNTATMTTNYNGNAANNNNPALHQHRCTIIDYVKDGNSSSSNISTRSPGQQLPKKLKKHQHAVGALILRTVPGLERRRLVCQLGTGQVETAVRAALHVRRDVAAIDVNMGCPKKFSTSGGMGSALLSDPDRACRIIRALTEAVSVHPMSTITDLATPAGLEFEAAALPEEDDTTNEYTDIVAHGPIPVSAKIRLLKDVQSTVDFVSALIGAGAKAVAIHGRRVGDRDVNPADWTMLETVVQLCKSKFPTVPILINGDFYTRDEFSQFQHRTGASGVLLARPALFNTSIFRKPSSSPPSHDADAVSSYGYDSPLLLDKTTVVQDYLRLAVQYGAHYKNVKYVVTEMMQNRRTPHTRVPYLKQVFASPKTMTIYNTCACQSLEQICQLWDVRISQRIGGCITTATAADVLTPGEHTYSDSYILQSAAATVAGCELGTAGTRAAHDDPTSASKRVKLEAAFVAEHSIS